MVKIKQNGIFVLNGNMLKIIALISMTVDHIGYFLFPKEIIFRIIGRLAFPIFAYMISEGCRYTRNKTKYLGTMLVFAGLCQIEMTIATKTLYLNIFVTFSLSIILIYAYECLKNKKNGKSIALFLITLISIIFVAGVLPRILPSKLDFFIDYGLVGIFCPFLVYLGFDKVTKLSLCAISLILLSFTGMSIQWFCLFALIPLALYNGKRGRLNLKYLFYIYYPLHIGAINLILYLTS